MQSRYEKTIVFGIDKIFLMENIPMTPNVKKIDIQVRFFLVKASVSDQILAIRKSCCILNLYGRPENLVIALWATMSLVVFGR